ncbi:MAG: hypothetical protein ABFD04_09975 [Syntrophomonas sp.]
MTVLKKTIIPLGRPLFIPKEGNLTIDDLEIETAGAYQLIDKPDHIILKNDECCRSIEVTIHRKDKE